jgi:hypothetical protein
MPSTMTTSFSGMLTEYQWSKFPLCEYIEDTISIVAGFLSPVSYCHLSSSESSIKHLRQNIFRIEESNLCLVVVG